MSLSQASGLKGALTYGTLNLAILLVTGAACIASLWAASQPLPVPLRVLAAISFALAGNTMFALLHEAVHGNFHPCMSVNDAAGRCAAAFFPTAFSLQRAFHLAHHRNNRSNIERFDYYDWSQSRLLRILQWYCILTGLYWLAPPLFALTYSVTARLIPWQSFFVRGNTFGDQTSARAFLESIRSVSVARVRGDVVVTIGVQALIVWLAGVSLLGWCLCYGFFAMSWSSLQYADHAFSKLDREQGAWNLKVSPIIRAVFLNYHFHLVHHMNPAIRWRDLPAAEGSRSPSLPFLRVLLCMWAGPRPLPGDAAVARQRPREDARDFTVNLMLAMIFGVFFWGLYGSASIISAANSAIGDISLPGEASIPFMAWAGPIYLSALAILMLSPFLLPTPERFLPLVVTAAFQVAVCWWIYVLFPISPPLPPPQPPGVAGMLFRFADVLNLEGNMLPSLHVALSATVAMAVGKVRGAAVRWGMGLWALAIALSTLLTRQHFILDVLAGWGLAWASMRWLHPFLVRQMEEGFRQLGVPVEQVHADG